MAKNSMGPDNLDTGETILWQGKTHFKVLFKPILIQLGLLILHYLVAVYVPANTSWNWWDSWGQLILQSILILVSIWYVIVPLLKWRHGLFEVTNRRVIKHWGVINKHSLEISLEQITSVSVERDLLDRIFGCGTMSLQDASSVDYETNGSWNRGPDNKNLRGVKFYDVPKILEVKAIVDKARFARP